LNDKKDMLKDYIEVNVRVEKFYERFPNGRIVTELVSWSEGVVVMKAYAYRDINDSVPSATGHAYEKEGSTYINKTSALENCETSAVGRALAMLGFEIKKSIASKEEVGNAKLNQQQSKVIGEIKSVWLALGMKSNMLDQQVQKLYGVSLIELDDDKAREFLEKLRAKQT
jgi:hypothetical protein